MINQNIFSIVKTNAEIVKARLGSKGYSNKECIEMTLELMKIEAIQKQTREIQKNTEILNDIYKLKLEES